MARGVALAYFIAFTFLVIWPGALIYNRATPLILGLPFNLFVIALLVLGGLAVLFMLYRAEGGDEE